MSDDEYLERMLAKQAKKERAKEDANRPEWEREMLDRQARRAEEGAAGDSHRKAPLVSEWARVGLVVSLTVGAVYFGWEPVQEYRAVELVKGTQKRVGGLLGLAGHTRSWKEHAEAMARDASGSTSGWSWSAERVRDSNTDLYFVRYANGEGMIEWVANLGSDGVTRLSDDPVSAWRLGRLRLGDPPTPRLLMTYDYKGTARCGSGVCFRIKGSAKNVTGEPIVSVDATAEIYVVVGSKYAGTTSWAKSGKMDRFRGTSPQKPWMPGEERTFEYWSDSVPAAFAMSKGEALGIFEVVSETSSKIELRQDYGVTHLDWPAQ